MKTKRFVSTLLALLLICGLPLSAFADNWYLENGDITVNATESGQTVTQGSVDVLDSAPVITQSDSSSTPTTNTVTINAAENATANVTIQDVNIVISDPAGSNQNHSGEAAVTINVADNASANVTLDGVRIDTENTGGVPILGLDDPYQTSGYAAVQITGNGNVALELDGENTLQGGYGRAGVEKNTTDDTGNGNLTITDENGTAGSLKAKGGEYSAGIGGGWRGSGSNITISGSNITISGNAEVTATGGLFGAGIGGGIDGSGNNITITGNAKAKATGGQHAAGIGGGYRGSGSENITVSGDAQVKAQGGESEVNSNAPYATGAGAAIGNGGRYQHNTTDAESVKGQEVAPNTDELTPNGKIEYYTPVADMKTADPYKTVIGTYAPSQPTEPAQPSQPAAEAAPLYRVIGKAGKALACKAEQKDGVLTVTADADYAALTGKLGGIQTLKAQGVDTIVFVTNNATSTFALSDLLSQGSTGDSYTLTHDGGTVTFTLNNGADAGTILQ